MAEIQRADKQSLKLAILALVMLLLGGVVLSVQFEAWLAEVRRMPIESARKSLTTVFSWSVGIVTVAIALAGCHVWRGEETCPANSAIPSTRSNSRARHGGFDWKIGRIQGDIAPSSRRHAHPLCGRSRRCVMVGAQDARQYSWLNLCR